MTVRISCINKANGLHENPYVAISHLNWVQDETGKTGRSTREEMYTFVEDQKGTAYVQSGSSRAVLMGAVSARGTNYVKTVANDTSRDNLLKLPECS
jgi:hypothetical protein